MVGFVLFMLIEPDPLLILHFNLRGPQAFALGCISTGNADYPRQNRERVEAPMAARH
jgi:hypothetical protein